ncbi:MAG: CBS domain-containing protein [Methylococcales bacterium]|nr:CBS domain-containing protein [Methylococcales bacterium]
MLKEITVANYMAKKIVTLKQDTEILAAINQLLSHRITSAPVLDDKGQLLGIFSEKDCIKVALETVYNKGITKNVSDYMLKDIATVDVDASIIELAEQFEKSDIRSYPVYDEGKLVGMISRADILRALVAIL